ncbi:MAG: hypothetical protein AAGA48_09475 [Myxococcota bacterium]
MTPETLARLDRPWLIGATFLLFVVGNALILPEVTHFEELSGGIAMLELPTQLTQDLRAVAASYPPAAVDHYLGVLLPLDLLYPATAGLFFATWLFVLSRRLFAPGSLGRQLPWLGAAMTLADWSENLGVYVVLTSPRLSDSFELAARLAIASKFAIGSATVVLALGLTLAWGLPWFTATR